MSQSLQEPERHGVIAVTMRDDKLLVIRRSRFVIAPGKLCFPGGGIERCHQRNNQLETPEQALVREFREELGETITPVQQIWESTTEWGIHLYWWVVRLGQSFTLTPNPQEVESVEWLTLDEMRTHPDVLSSNLPFLDLLAGQPELLR